MAPGRDKNPTDWRAEAKHWRAEAARFAADTAALEVEAGLLRSQVSDLQAQVAVLTARLSTFARRLFGTSSEKKQPSPRDDVEGQTPSDDGRRESRPRRRRGQQPGTKGHGRRDYAELETEEVVHDLDEADRVCAQCKTPYEPFGEESSAQIEWRVRLVRIVHRRRRYRACCRCADKGVLVAPSPPKPIPKGMFTSLFLARLLVEKYVLARPLARITAALAFDGLKLSSGTLCGALQAVSDLLWPLDQAIRKRNAAAAHLHIDETSWRVFEELAGKANHRWWLWVFVASDTVAFVIDPTRSAKVLEAHLGIRIADGALTGERHLVVSADFFTVYQSLARVDGVEMLWCWAHIRRYFIRAADAHKELRSWCEEWLEAIRALYSAHEALGRAKVGTKAHLEATEHLGLALGEIDTRRQKQLADPSLHPAAAKVLSTLDHEWDGLSRHRELPDLPLDNNAAERAIRGPVVGRKNYYGSGAAWAATLAQRLWTISATAHLHDLNPLSYLCRYLDACAKAGGKPLSEKALSGFLPWQAAKADLQAWRAPPSLGGSGENLGP